ncbi:glycosyltransferase [Aequorivita sp. 609]|nr:glycosyltransferase [Aequorivita sp. 609]MBB6681531.1 glycosyltransferase [Aequorivita sp. 609]
MAKKNVLFLINNLGGGGAEKVLVNLVNNLDKNKYYVTLRTLIDHGENKEDLNRTIIYESIFKKGFKGINFLHLLPKTYIYNKIAYGQFDVIIVYLHGVLTKIVANAPSSQKTIAYLHSNMEHSPFIKSFKSKKKLQSCFNSYNAIVSVSKSVEESFKNVSGIDNNLHLIYNTFDVQGIKDKSLENIEDGSKLIGEIKLCSVGKLNKVKGYQRLLKVVKRLVAEDIHITLTIVGEGRERRTLEDFITRSQLQNYVKLVGFQLNPYKYIADSDLFVCSSFSEGFSSVVVESIILGVPVLSTDCAGMHEILGKNNEYGMIVENDEESLYRGLKDIVLDSELLQQYKRKAEKRASFFSTEKAVLDVENLIDKLINNE